METKNEMIYPGEEGYEIKNSVQQIQEQWLWEKLK
jgi:hypothetical protein